MRILSLSHRLMNPSIDNHHIFNAPAVVDYEAIVVDVAELANTIRNAVLVKERYETYASLPVVNGEPIDGVAGIADTLRRRRDEFTRALERGAVVIVMAHPPAPISGVAGYQGLDNYFFLPAPTGLSWDRATIRGGEGTTCAIAEPDHPTADVIDTYRRDLIYRCYFDDRAPGFAGNARVIGRSEGGVPTAVEFAVLNGRVIFLPPPREAGARHLIQRESKALVTAFDDLLKRSDENAPRWLPNIEVPGLHDLDQERALRQAAVERAQAELATASGAVDDLSVLRDVLWRTGDHGLRPAALRCAEVLGFAIDETRDGDPLLLDGDRQLHLVVAGSEEAVDMAPHYRLRARLDAIIERRAEVPRGLIVANGQRLTRPAERQRQIAPALRVAAESVGYAVVTATDLYDAATASLAGLSEETRAAIRTRLLNVDGIVTLDDLLRRHDPPTEPASEPAEEPEPVAADS